MASLVIKMDYAVVKTISWMTNAMLDILVSLSNLTFDHLPSTIFSNIDVILGSFALCNSPFMWYF